MCLPVYVFCWLIAPGITENADFWVVGDQQVSSKFGFVVGFWMLTYFITVGFLKCWLHMNEVVFEDTTR